ncbi:MAG: hypothetical protein H7249_06315 [Chitinophagaceae bacterium]|nr:hypothetical protein [Oligoflexus sp.]
MKKINDGLTHFIYTIIVLAAVGLTGSCTKQSRSPSLDENPQSGACADLNLVRDASWTSGFVKAFVSCLSEGNQTSHDKFALTLGVIDKIGSDSFQATLDLFKWESNGKEPFLGMVSSFLNRGVSDDSSKRWRDTQALLADTKPYALINLMIELKKRDLLNPLLDVMESTDNALPQGFLETGVRQFLSDKTVRADAEVLVRAFLADAETFDAINHFLTPERRILNADCVSDPACPYSGAGEMKSTTQHWLDFWSSLSPERRNHLAAGMSELVKGTLEQDNDAALDRSNRLLVLVTQAIAHSKNFYTQGHEALAVLLDTPITAYQPFMEGLNLIKDNPVYLDAFQEKMGSSSLQDMMEEMLWKGGQPKACSQKIAGLSEGNDEPSRRALLNELLRPQATCGGKVPVLVAMSEWLGYECPQNTCSISLIADAPHVSSEYTAFAAYVFKHTAEVLANDPWTLYRQGASRRDITQSIWQEITRAGLASSLDSPQSLLTFETQMAAHYAEYLPGNWLELIVNQNLLELSTVEQSFAGVFPDRNPIEQWYFADSDPQFARIMYGLYPQGPADQALNRLFRLDQVEKDWFVSHPKSKVTQRELAQIVAPLRSLSSVFRSPAVSFKPEAEKIALPWLGSAKNSPSFGKDGHVENAGDALKLSLLFDDSANGLSFKARYLEQLGLATASLPVDEADEFQRWMKDVWLPGRIAVLDSVPVAAPELPTNLFDRTALSVQEARTLPYFMGTEFAIDMNKLPAGSVINSLPETNLNPKSQAPRTLSGSVSLGGTEHPWTSFWLFQNQALDASHTSLQSLFDAVGSDAAGIQTAMSQATTAPILVSQGLLDSSDAARLNDHQKLLLQLHLMSPILENRGKQYFVPSIGFANYCPQKSGDQWTGTACPFQYNSFANYRRFVSDRFAMSLCTVLPMQDEVLQAMGLTDSAASARSLCASHISSTRLSSTWLQANLVQTLRLGKNPRLKENLKNLPGELRWLKAQDNHGPKQIVKAYLGHAPIVDGRSSAKVLQRLGTYQAFFSGLPSAGSVWMLYLSHDIGLRGISDSLKALGNSPVGTSRAPIQDLLNLVARTYDDAKAKKQNTLLFGINLLTEFAKNEYARETLVRLLGKPYDPYAGVLIGYTLPQAVKAGILPDFTWSNYAPLRVLLQSQNLYFLQGLADIYDRDTLDWLDYWTKIVGRWPSTDVMAADVEPMLQWARAYLKSSANMSPAELNHLLVMRDWKLPLEAATREYRLLRVSLLDLSNKWHDAFYFQSEALCKAILESLPRLLSLKDSYELGGGDKRLMVDAFLGMIQGPLKHDGLETAAWLEDERMGFRAPSFIGAALHDTAWRSKINTAVDGLSHTSHSEWVDLKAEWVVMAPHSHKLIDYMAKNIVLHGDKALYEKQGLESLSVVTGDDARWRDTQTLLDSWLDEASVLDQWQTQTKQEALNR